MHYVVTLETPPDVPEEAREAQRLAIRALAEQGVLALAGPFTDGLGGMAILRAADLDEATTIYSTTPLAARELVRWTIREWNPRAGTEAERFS